MRQTPDPLAEDAINFAQVLLVRRVLRHRPGWLDEDDARQDVSAFTLEHLHTYRAEKGAVTTWVATMFDQWYRAYLHLALQRAEHIDLYDPLPAWDDEDNPSLAARMLLIEAPDTRPPHEQSELAETLLSLIPERDREAVELHFGYGVSLTATAEILGIKKSSVEWRTNKARALWRDCYERAA